MEMWNTNNLMTVQSQARLPGLIQSCSHCFHHW
jgi:hypothetical protein